MCRSSPILSLIHICGLQPFRRSADRDRVGTGYALCGGGHCLSGKIEADHPVSWRIGLQIKRRDVYKRQAYSKPPVELVVADLVFARKNNPMDIESIDKKCEDTDISIIRNEIELFFEDKAKLFVFKDQYFYLEGKNICMSGDNLITQKQMWRRAYRKRKAPDNAKNDDEFFAYIILPRIRNIYRSNVNNVRNSTYGYNDNPFLFFKVLRNIYICEFDETKASEPLDYVEKAIIQTKLSLIHIYGASGEGNGLWHFYEHDREEEYW